MAKDAKTFTMRCSKSIQLGIYLSLVFESLYVVKLSKRVVQQRRIHWTLVLEYTTLNGVMYVHRFPDICWCCAKAHHDDVIKWKHFPRYWPFCGEYTGHQWIPRTKASDAELWCFIWSALDKWLSKQWWGRCLGGHRAHYDVTSLLCVSTYPANTRLALLTR